MSRDPSDERQTTNDENYLTVATRDKNVRKTTYLLAGLLCLGMLCLWLMIKNSTPQTAPAATAGTEEAQIEMAITRLTGVRSEMFGGLERIVKKFYEFSDVQQVDVEELVKNPFRTEKFLGIGKESSDIAWGEFDADALMQQMAQQAEGMQLFSIMESGQSSCCMIDDRILYEGDSISGFTVRRIGANFVELVPSEKEALTELESTGGQVILRLSEDSEW